MKTTPLRGYPVPECNPPLVKDASDVIQIKNLADAIDADVEGLTVAANPRVFPPASKMFNGGLVTADAQFPMVFPSSIWQTHTGMNDTDLQAIVIPETGFYQVALWASVTSSATLQMRTRLLVNNVPRGAWGGYSAPVAGFATQEAVHDVNLFLSEGDQITSEIRRDTTTSLTFTARVHVLQLARS